MKKKQLYFLGYFLIFPLIFITSFLLWGSVIKGNGLWTVMTDALSIIGIYYILTSIIFSFVMRKQVKFENE
ncbi:hypothetical protein [Rossellomorea aquimaris]|uniref:hypothetical protein n=1 Tax=Rossellomorea aquimaris TaxID=189382 RepID=UPI0011E95F63|nr:hypothetical protein [Rossellomorea aquimaris]TYS89923.1 hypothetical protein FZC88_10065 [Rossellomorea aquimaris]